MRCIIDHFRFVKIDLKVLEDQTMQSFMNFSVFLCFISSSASCYSGAWPRIGRGEIRSGDL
jgi:hypothetical protein